MQPVAETITRVVYKHQPCAQKTPHPASCATLPFTSPVLPKPQGKAWMHRQEKCTLHGARGLRQEQAFHEQALGECFRENKNPVFTLISLTEPLGRLNKSRIANPLKWGVHLQMCHVGKHKFTLQVAERDQNLPKNKTKLQKLKTPAGQPSPGWANHISNFRLH